MGWGMRTQVHLCSTQLLSSRELVPSSSCVVLYVHRNHVIIVCVCVCVCVIIKYGLLGMGEKWGGE